MARREGGRKERMEGRRKERREGGGKGKMEGGLKEVREGGRKGRDRKREGKKLSSFSEQESICPASLQ
jgi:hypothetical protein